MKANFNVLSQPCTKLCLFKVAKSDACIGPLFTNLVTYLKLLFLYSTAEAGVKVDKKIEQLSTTEEKVCNFVFTQLFDLSMFGWG